MIITLTGINEYQTRQTLDALVEQFTHKHGPHSVERLDGEALETHRLTEMLQGVSLFATERLIVLRGAAKNKILWDTLAQWLERIPDETTLVVVEPALDKRTKTYKALQKLSDFRDHGDVSEGALVTWLQQQAAVFGGQIDNKTARYLLDRVGTDQWKLSNELQKLSNYQPTITIAAIDELTDSTPQASAFELLDAALAGKPAVVTQLLGKLAAAEDPYRFFGLLVSQVQALALVQSAGNRAADAIAKEAGLHPFVVRKTQSLAKTIEHAVVALMIEAVARCDDQLKSTGADPWFLLEQCLGKIASQARA